MLKNNKRYKLKSKEPNLYRLNFEINGSENFKNHMPCLTIIALIILIFYK